MSEFFFACSKIQCLIILINMQFLSLGRHESWVNSLALSGDNMCVCPLVWKWPKFIFKFQNYNIFLCPTTAAVWVWVSSAAAPHNDYNFQIFASCCCLSSGGTCRTKKIIFSTFQQPLSCLAVLFHHQKCMKIAQAPEQLERDFFLCRRWMHDKYEFTWNYECSSRIRETRRGENF